MPVSINEMRSDAAVRAADAMLRSMGGDTILFKLPINAGNNNADLGLGSSGSIDIALAPAVLRREGSGDKRRVELLVSASSVRAQMKLQGIDSAEAFFDCLLGVVIGGKLLRLESEGAEEFAGTPYLYRLIAIE